MNKLTQKRHRSFASDNNAGIHPAVIAAIDAANSGDTVAYGDDAWTSAFNDCLIDFFGEGTHGFLVANGTAANVLGLQSVIRPYHSILATDCSHIGEDECQAPESRLGCQIIKVPHAMGKLPTEDFERSLDPYLAHQGDPHHGQVKVLSLTQSTEFGTVYSVSELQALTDWAHKNNLIVHMDGARLSNAAASLGVTLKAITRDIGVDILSLGGTKNGLMGAEAVVFFNPELAKDFAFIRKNGMQLISKHRFVAAQFLAFFQDNLWQRNAAHANHMAQLLAAKIEAATGIKPVFPVEANGVFLALPRPIIQRLQEEYFFYVFDECRNIIRLMTHFATQEDDLQNLVDALAGLLSMVH
ncbi:MAG: threonine aldolase [Cyanobacteria bacterium]|nr:threonine aldolase [Cyanobacteriota bacterium]